MSTSPSLPDKVAFLSTSAAYGPGTGPVTPLETHWSWVFLTPDRVFKLKKPLKRPWIDLMTLDAREANCREELRLNRRLTDGIYTQVLPLCETPDGHLALGGEGRVVDWLLEMKRLPANRMLDTLLEQGQVSGDEITALGQRLAEFYAALPPQIADGGLYLEHLRVEAVENRRVLATADIGLAAEAIGRILDAVDRLLDESTPVIRRASRNRALLRGMATSGPSMSACCSRCRSSIASNSIAACASSIPSTR